MNEPTPEAIAQLFIELSDIPSTNAKKQFIADNEKNTHFISALSWLLNPYIVTGLDIKKLTKRGLARFRSFDTFSELREYLTTHNTGTDADIACVQGFINKSNCRDFLQKYFSKTLKCGVDYKLVNSVIPNCVPHFDIMLGTPYEKCENRIIDGKTWFSISQKMNGTRIVYHRGKLYTRSGREYIGLEHIANDINGLVRSLIHVYPEEWCNEWTFDGELIYCDDTLTDSERFQIGTGIANSKDKDKSMLRMVIFDVLPSDEFEVGVSKETYRQRLKRLNQIEDLLKDGKPNVFTNIELVRQFHSGTDKSVIKYYLDYAENNDFEGIMLNLDTPYVCKRTKDLIKCKVFKDMELEVIELEKGTNKYDNTLGALVCKIPKYNAIVRVGSGFSDRQRDEFWNNPDSIIGKLVTVKYKELTHDKNGNASLQFPIFVNIRENWDA